MALNTFTHTHWVFNSFMPGPHVPSLVSERSNKKKKSIDIFSGVILVLLTKSNLCTQAGAGLFI